MKYFGNSDKGFVREINQDSFYCGFNEHHEFLAIVCDGIGGGLAGDVASSIGMHAMKESFLSKKASMNKEDIKNWIEEAVFYANDLIYKDSLTSKKKQGMGTTLVGVIIVQGVTYVFHLGDSRVYGLFDDFICLTEDHNLAADLIKSGEFSEEEAFAHPKSKALTNALGIWSQYNVEINRVKKDYQYLLLCSDGLHGYVSEEYIEHVLRSNFSVEEKVDALIEAANNAGGYDNVTVIIIDKEGSSEDGKDACR